MYTVEYIVTGSMNKARKDDAPTFVTEILRVTEPQEEELEPEGRIILIGTSNAGRVSTKLHTTYNVEYVQVMTQCAQNSDFRKQILEGSIFNRFG